MTTRIAGDTNNAIGAFHSISADGRYVVFKYGDHALFSDTDSRIFLRDRETGTTVNLPNLGLQGANTISSGEHGTISGDGRFVAFQTFTYTYATATGRSYICVRNIQEQTTINAALAPDGSALAGICFDLALSFDGRFLVFTTYDSATGAPVIYLRDLQQNTTELVSRRHDGTTPTSAGHASVSADGRYVVFHSSDTNMLPVTVTVTNDSMNNEITVTNSILPAGVTQIYLKDRTVATNRLITVVASGSPATNSSFNASITPDGRYVSFLSEANNLVAGDSNGALDVFVYDRQSDTISRAAGPAIVSSPRVSSDGRWIAFASVSALVAGDTNGFSDVYVFDRQNGTYTRSSTALGGASGNGPSSGFASGSSGRIAISGDGRYVGFDSTASNLTYDDTNPSQDVFVHDRGGLFNDPRSQGGPAANPYVAFGSDDQAPTRVGLPVYHVNTSTLNLALQGTLFWMKARGPSIAVRLTYNSDHTQPACLFGKNWSFNYCSTIQSAYDGYRYHVRKGSGQVLTYTAPVSLLGSPDLPVELAPPPGSFDRLTFHGTHWLLREKAGRYAYRYEPSTAGGANVSFLTAISDRNDNTVTLGVDLANGRINTITDPASRTLNFTYDGSGRCTQITLPGGRMVSFRYDAAGYLDQITDMMGSLGGYVYDAEGYLTQMSTAGRITAFTHASRGFDAGKFVSQVNDQSGGITRYDLLSVNPVTVRRTTRDGRQSTFKSNADGLTSEVADPLNNVRSIGYQDSLPVGFTNTTGKIVRVEYDIRGNVTKQVDALNNEMRFTYDANDNLLTRNVPALGQTWTYTYDGKGNITSIRTPLGNDTALAYNSQGQLVSVTDPKGAQTSYAYDSHGNVSTITDPLSQQTSFSYDGSGRCLSITDARGNQKQLVHDNNDRLTRIGYGPPPSGTVAIQNTFNPFGQTEVSDELNRRTQAARNEFGFITQITTPLNLFTRYEYDGDNNRTNVIDALNRSTRTSLDAAGRPTLVIDPLNRTVTRFYDSEGNLERLRDARNKDTTFLYDDNNRLQETTDPLGRKVTITTRDALGRVVTQRNSRNQTVGFAYDADGRLTSKTHDSVQQAAFAYDRAGNLTNVTDATGVTSYTYDARNQLTAIRYPNALTVGFAYDAVGNVSSIGYPGGLVINYAYDNFNRVRIPARFRNAANTEIRPNVELPNRVTSMSWGGNTISFQFDAASQLTRETRSSGTTTDYAYDADGRVTSIIHKTNTASFLSLAYTYDAVNNTTAEAATPALDPLLNTGSFSASYNDANQVVSWGADAHTYDLDGNLTLVSGGKLTAAYDAENRLTQSTRLNVTATYAYNGVGDRVSAATVGQTTLFYYDRSGRLLFETDAGGAIRAYYLYNGRRLMAAGTPAGGYRYYHFNKTGHAVALTDGAGAVIQRYAYHPFGTVTRYGSAVANRFTYVGAHGVQDDGGGLFFMRRRHYDAGTGKFLQRDPIGFDGGVNLYAYAINRPVDYVDPKGNIAFAALGIGSLFSAAASIYYKYDERQTALAESEAFAHLQNKFDSSVREGKEAERLGSYLLRSKTDADVEAEMGLVRIAGEVSKETLKFGIGKAVEAVAGASSFFGSILSKPGDAIGGLFGAALDVLEDSVLGEQDE